MSEEKRKLEYKSQNYLHYVTYMLHNQSKNSHGFQQQALLSLTPASVGQLNYTVLGVGCGRS